MKGRRTPLSWALAFSTVATADNEEDAVTERGRGPLMAETTIKRIREGDSWDYSVTGFLAGGFRVFPLSGELTYSVSSGGRLTPGGPEVLALSYALNLTGGGRPFTDRGVVHFRQLEDRSLVEYGTGADGRIERGPALYLPGTPTSDYRTERDFQYQNGAVERGGISVIAAREIETLLGEYPAFKVEDLHKRIEANGSFAKVNDTGWFVPRLGFFARGTATIRAYDTRGRFQHFQLLGFRLESATLFD